MNITLGNMSEIDILREELEFYRDEKEKVRRIIGQVGGATSRHRDLTVNIVFLVLVLSSFLFEVIRHVLGLQIDIFPTVVSIELAILLVSLKIIWMIHKQAKVDHFQFWILNSIEFQINQIAKRLIAVEKTLREREESPR